MPYVIAGARRGCDFVQSTAKDSLTKLPSRGDKQTRHTLHFTPSPPPARYLGAGESVNYLPRAAPFSGLRARLMKATPRKLESGDRHRPPPSTTRESASPPRRSSWGRERAGVSQGGRGRIGGWREGRRDRTRGAGGCDSLVLRRAPQAVGV